MTDTRYYITKKRVDWKNVSQLCIFGVFVYVLVGLSYYCFFEMSSVYSFYERIFLVGVFFFAFCTLLYLHVEDLSINFIKEKKVWVKTEKVKK